MHRLKIGLGLTKQRKSSQNLQSIIKPLYAVASLIGLFPYRVVFVKNKHCFTVINKSVYVNSLCGVTVCSILFVFFTFHIREILIGNENINLTEAIMTQMNYILEVFALILFCVVAYVCAFLNRKTYVKMLNQITSTWYELPSNDNRQRILTYLQFQVNVTCIGTLLVLLAIQICVNFTRNNSLWKIMLVSFTFNLPQMVQFVTLSIYYMLVMMVVGLMMSVEWNCRNLLPMNTSDGFVHVQNKSMLTLRQMKLVYVKAFEVKVNINEAFQGPILATALQCFHSIVSEAHIIYHGVVVQKSITTHELINCSIWIMYQILKIYTLAYSGNLLKLQALKIGQVLHNIPTEKRDERWLMEIQHFSTLMSYQDIELNVYGYFPLNATFMYNTMASATMYLIILVQFDHRE